ncbi:translation initiation factor IF-2 [Anaplasma phagocytophilum]|uniref:translation initiation factor IF-2 n=1 Tax=Anaplasma phagocytophilum TaxID=948 RepID=UPI00200DE0F1|nr:translation initiation factor IF-2 [Anaplasma phagocytophilum]UQD54722.1 translation initiation factor IF-2 [Anaplasma phagocytophilum]
MSDVEKVDGECSASGKRERLTLKLGDKLKVPPSLTRGTSTGKSFTTVEVRSKKRRSGEYISHDDKRRSGLNKAISGLTAQEQLFRINAINMADSISAKEKELAAARRAKEEEELATAEAAVVEEAVEEEVSVEGDVPPVEAVEAAVPDVEEVVAPVATPSHSNKGGHDDRGGKKYAHGATGRHKEKEGVSIKKVASSRGASKHIKLDIENALSGLEDKRVTRFSSSTHKRRSSNIKSGRRISREVVISDKMTVRDLALAMAEKANDVLRMLSHVGVEARMDTGLDSEVACEIAVEFGHRPRVVSIVKMERELSDVCGDDFVSEPRPPVVTVMGHVDHGKTSLLDVLRKSNVAEKEFRGITQHIGAYQIDVDGKKITFLDTPGHEAFADMRARGANVTDIVVLVVAADDGIMPQTVESINHVKAAGVAMVVAVNKIDKSDADVGRITNELLQYGVIAEELGGDVMIVPVSAKTGENIDKLQSAILLLAEMLELSAPRECRAQGVVIEAKIDRGCGVVATVIVQKGTLKKGDVIVAGDSSYGKVRSMFDDADRVVTSALPAMPVRVLGLNAIPKAGDALIVMPSEKQARDLLWHRSEINSAREENRAVPSFSGAIMASMDSKVEEINLILKADVAGSMEAVSCAVEQLVHEEVKFNVLHKEMGDVTKSDVLLAEVSSAVILAFNVRVDAKARDLLRSKKVDVRHYQVIYDLVDDVRNMVSGKLKPIVQEMQVGLLTVRQMFSSGKSGTVLGCYVTEGAVTRGATVRVCRGETVIGEGTVKALRRFKEDVKEVNRGLECGLLVDGVKGVLAGDVIKVLEIVERVRGVE